MTIEQPAMAMTVEDFLEYVKESKSKHTFKEYRISIKKFSEYFGKTPNEIMRMRTEDWVSGDLHRKKRFTREIEKYHARLLKSIHTIKGKPNQAYSINSARNYCLGILQLFRYYEMPITIPTGSDVSKTVISTKDFVPTPQQYREMYNVADSLKAKLIVSMGLNLGWRIGDFVKIQKDMLPILDEDAPIAFELITEKEDVLAKSFLSQETVDLLKQYIETVKDNPNPYLFPSNHGKYIDTDTVNNILRDLAQKAKVRIPKTKRLRFHCFRKRFLSECANLSVDINTAKIMCGKNVEKDMLTYLSEVEHKKAFEEVHRRLQLTEVKAVINAKDAEIEALNKRIGELEIMNKGLIEMLAKNAKALGIGGDLSEDTAKATIIERIKELGKQAIEKEQAEYKKLIDNNNNH